MLGKRAPVVRQHTATVLSGQHSLARHTGARFSVKRMHDLPKQALTTLLAEETQVLAVPRSLVVLDCLRPPIKTREQTVDTRRHHTPSYEPWRTVQGLGTLVAHTITREPGALSRLPPVGHSAASGRGVDSTQSSNGKRTGTGKVKNGPPYWAWASLEAAQFARRVQPDAQRFYPRQLAPSRTHTVLARQAVAHTLSRACYDILRDRVPFEATQALG